MATNKRHYEEKGFEFEFTPGDGGPYNGMLVVRAPEVEDTYTAEISLSKPRSCNEYAGRASELSGMSKQPIQAALNALCSRRYEEVTAAEIAQEEPDPEDEPEVDQAEINERIGRPGVLGRFVDDAAKISRVVGDRESLSLVALAALSGQLAPLPNGRPLVANVIVTAPPGRGKNFLADAVGRLLPPQFFFPFESASGKALFYAAAENPFFLQHKWLYPNEAEAADLLVEVLRPLLSGGSARHVTVNKDGQGRNVGTEFVVEGPVSVTIPTVRNKLDSQLQSRMLVADLRDYEGRVAAHSAAVSEQLSSGHAGTDYSGEIHAWRAAFVSLTDLRRVVLPVADGRFRFDADEVSHGARLWTNMLGLMATHAWLEQRNREMKSLPNGERAIVAGVEDYEAAYRIFESTCERSVVNLSETHKKILDAAYRLQEEMKVKKGEWDPHDGLSQRKIAQKAGISQSTVSENKTFLTKSVKILRETEGGGLALVKEAEPSWWDTGDALLGFPQPEQVREWWKGDKYLSLGSESTDQTDENLDDTSTPDSEADPAVPRDDRENCGDDRGNNNRKNPFHKPDSSIEEPGAGSIGGSEIYLSKSTSDRSATATEATPVATLGRVNDKRQWVLKPAPVALKGLGWSRTKSFAEQNPEAGEKARAEIPWRMHRDPAVEVIQRAVWCGEGYSGTVWYLLTKANKNRGEPYGEWMDELGYPSTLEEMDKHRERLAAALQGEPSPGGPAMRPEHDGKYLHAECWEKPGAERVLVFTCVGPEGPKDGEVEKLVWERVAIIENPMDW